ncbi:MAG: hypothetical protein KGI25_00945 [Thaumarchaeota archaeon]|nr:hypothetical protein [Nitrososphaerota archaeon]
MDGHAKKVRQGFYCTQKTANVAVERNMEEDIDAARSEAFMAGKMNMKMASVDSTDVAAKKEEKALATTATRRF